MNLERRIIGKYVCYGTGVWVIVTLTVRLIGHWFMTCGTCPTYFALQGLTVVFAWGLGIFFTREKREVRVLASVAFVLPEMLLDIMTFALFDGIYPNLGAAASPLFGMWAIFAYFTMLTAGVMSAARK